MAHGNDCIFGGLVMTLFLEMMEMMYIKGNSGDDVLKGDAGIDIIYSHTGSDVLDGGTYLDRCYSLFCN